MTPTSVLATILSAIGSFVTSAVSWMTSFLGAITATGNELLLMFVVVGFVGLGIGLIRRLISL